MKYTFVKKHTFLLIFLLEINTSLKSTQNIFNKVEINTTLEYKPIKYDNNIIFFIKNIINNNFNTSKINYICLFFKKYLNDFEFSEDKLFI